MPGEVVAFNTNSFGNNEKREHKPRIQLHHESGPLSQQLHEMQMRHYELTMGLIALRETDSSDAIMTRKRDILARLITIKRAKQRELITKMAISNTQITREPYSEERYDPNSEHDRRLKKDVRAETEAPYVKAIYHDPENFTSLALFEYDSADVATVASLELSIEESEEIEEAAA